jgi:branched-chain amino acid transport system substrate-binding protein
VPWLCGCALALVLSACSSTSTPASSAVIVKGSTLDVWASEPPGAADAVSSDVLDAERLALKQAGGRAGAYSVVLRTAHTHEISANARAAVQDKSAIAYLGEIRPGTSGVSLQITNQVGLLQVSPTDTAVYLTRSTPAVSDSPGNYYPANGTYHHTFAREVPTTAAETTALASEMRALHVSTLSITGDDTTYGASVAAEMRAAAKAAGITPASGAGSADAVFYAGLNGPQATTALDRLAASSPDAKLFAPSALYDDTLVSGLSPAAQRNLYVSAPSPPPAGQSPAATTFATDFQSAYGHAPAPQAAYGYETMTALVTVLKDLGTDAASRSQVVARFRGLKNRQSALGTYSLSNGDTSLDSFVLARPVGGKLVPRSTP